MAARFEVDRVGLQELMASSMVHEGTYALAEVLLDLAKVEAPYDQNNHVSEHLRDSGHLVDDGHSVAVVFDAPHAAAVHGGTKPHVIKPRRQDGVLVFEVNGKTVFAKKVNHPGTHPDEFLQRAIDLMSEE